MRRVTYSDVACAARAVMLVSQDDRVALCRSLIERADTADRFRRRSGRSHPRWGTGSLMEVARQLNMAPEPGFDDPVYCAALGVVLSVLRERALSPRRS